MGKEIVLILRFAAAILSCYAAASGENYWSSVSLFLWISILIEDAQK